MSRLGVFVVPAVALSVIVVAGFIVRIHYQTLPGKQCWNCGAHRVRKSEKRAALDRLARLFLLTPSRCSRCLKRFYRFQIGRTEELPQHVQQD
jgi:hypothetical protein